MKYMNLILIIGLITVTVITTGVFIYTNIIKFDQEPIFPSEDFLEQELIFETISKGSWSGHNDRKNYVIKDNTKWSNLWDIVHLRVTPKPELPDINFNDEMIIAVFQGSRPTGGYNIEITGIIEKENSIEVFIKETSPVGIVTLVLTQPYHIVKIKKADKEVIFNHSLDRPLIPYFPPGVR